MTSKITLHQARAPHLSFCMRSACDEMRYPASTLHSMCSDLEKFSSALKLMESQSRPKVTSFYNCCPLKTQILKLRG